MGDDGKGAPGPDTPIPNIDPPPEPVRNPVPKPEVDDPGPDSVTPAPKRV